MRSVAGTAERVKPKIAPITEEEWRYLEDLKHSHGAEVIELGLGSSRKHIKIPNGDKLFNVQGLESDPLAKTDKCEGCQPGVANTVSVWVDDPSRVNLVSHHLKDSITLLQRHDLRT